MWRKREAVQKQGKFINYKSVYSLVSDVLLVVQFKSETIPVLSVLLGIARYKRYFTTCEKCARSKRSWFSASEC